MTNELNSDSMELMETTQARVLQVKLIKIGAKVVRHSRYVIFQMAEVLVSKGLFQEILERIHRLKPVLIGSVLYFGNLNFDIV